MIITISLKFVLVALILIIGFLLITNILHSTTIKEFRIKKGTHSDPLEFCPHFGITKMRRTITFGSSCIYEDKSGEGDWNKAFGFSYGHHHKNSVRIGWRCVDDKIETCLYSYVNGKRIINKLIYANIDIPYTFKIEYTENSNIRVLMQAPINLNSVDGKMEDDNRLAFVYHINNNDKPKRKVGYYLYPYFGGQEKAPHDMYMEIN